MLPLRAHAAEDDLGVLGVVAAVAAARRPPRDETETNAGSDAGSAASPSRDGDVVELRGVGVSLGMRAEWSLALADDDDADGLSFADAVTLFPANGADAPDAPPLASRSGYDHIAGVSWDVELGGGACRASRLDAEHRSQLVSWTRTGQWCASDAARRMLHVKLLLKDIELGALIAEHSIVPGGRQMTTEMAEPEPPSGDENGGRRRRRTAGAAGGGGRRANRKGAREKNSGGLPSSSASSSSSSLDACPPPPMPKRANGALVALAVRGGKIGARMFLEGAFYTLVPIRPRPRGERRSLRTLPGASLRPPLAFNPRHRRLSTPLLTPFNSI